MLADSKTARAQQSSVEPSGGVRAGAAGGVRWVELLWLAVTAGLLGGALFASFDAFYHAPDLRPRDALVAIALSSVPAIAVSLILTFALALAFRIAGRRPDAAVWVGLVASVSIVALASAIVLVGTKNHRDVSGLLLVLASLPFAAFACGLVQRLSWACDLRRSVVAGFVLLLSLVVGQCGFAMLRAWNWSAIAAVLPFAVAIVLGVAALKRLRRSPGRVAICVLVALPAVSIAFAYLGHPHPSEPARAVSVPTGKAPNVVLIVLDTMRRDRIGCYGNRDGLTPELDRLAAEGVVYEDAISAAPWTVPSHASMFTGFYPETHGATYTHHQWLDGKFTTLAEMLKAEGYETVALNSNITVSLCNLLQGFDVALHLAGPYDRLAMRFLSQYAGVPEHWVDKGCSEAYERLLRWLGDREHSETPFFLFLNLFEAHVPYVPPHRERSKAFPRIAERISAAHLGVTFNVSMHDIIPEPPVDGDVVSGLYDALVRYQDQRLGEILQLLRRATDFDNTLLIVVADHGENLGEANRWGHLFAINETLIHVPLVIRFPEAFPAGTRIDGMCQTIDILPTVYDVLGRPCPTKNLPGRTLVPGRFDPRKRSFSQVTGFLSLVGQVEAKLGHHQNLGRFTSQRDALRTEDWKFIWSSDGKHQLFSLDEDPFETNNLADLLPEVAAALEKKLLEWRAAQPVYVAKEASDQDSAPLDERTIQQLRSLGYLGD